MTRSSQESRGEGIRDKDALWFWNMHNIERLMMMRTSDWRVGANVRGNLRQGMTQQQAEAHSRRIHPLYGNPLTRHGRTAQRRSGVAAGPKKSVSGSRPPNSVDRVKATNRVARLFATCPRACPRTCCMESGPAFDEELNPHLIPVERMSSIMPARWRSKRKTKHEKRRLESS